MTKIRKSLLFTIILSMFLCFFSFNANAEETTNEKSLLSLTSFESGGFQGWVAFGGKSTISITNETAHEGELCIKTSSRTAVWSGPALNITNLVEPGTEVSFQAYIKCVSPDITPIVHMSLKSIDSNGTENYSGIAQNVVDNKEWVLFEGSYNIPENATDLTVYFQTEEGFDDFYIDDIKIFGSHKEIAITNAENNSDSYNYDFEKNLENWLPRGDISIITTKDFSYSGKNSLYVSGRKEFWNAPMVRLDNIKTGVSYNYTAYVMYNGLAYEQNHVFALKLQYSINGIETYSEIESKLLQKGTWSKISGDFVLPKNAENIVFYIQTEDAINREPDKNDLMSFYVDNVVIFDNTLVIRQRIIHICIVSAVSLAVLILVVFVGYKIYRKSKSTKELLMSAKIDAMTKTFNRNTFEEFTKHLESSPEKCKKYYMTVCDVNFLKYINDNYGHEYGDMAITRCAEVLLKTIGKKGKVYRTGGDEFMCITKYDPSNALKTEIALEASLHYKGYPFSVAVGTAHYDRTVDFDTPDIKAIIKRSDSEMYKHKQEIKRYKTEFSKEFSVDRKANTVTDN